jgi:hypothetical protein
MALAAGPASAARNVDAVPDNLTETIATPNFLVHFTSTFGDPNGIGTAQVQQLAGNAERALGDLISRTDFPRPMDDGDGKIDLYVFYDKGRPEPGLFQLDEGNTDRTSGWIAIPPNGATDIVTIAHQVFHLMQANVYRPAGRILGEGGATWASLHLYAPELRSLPDDAQFFPNDPLDCTTSQRCANPATGAWQFFELLAERYGADTLRRLYDRSRALGEQDGKAHFREALDEVLAAQNTTLPAAFADFTRANLIGGYALRLLAKRRYGATEPHADIVTGRRDRRYPSRGVTLDRLSAAFYRVVSSPAEKRCRRATLTLTLDGPVGLEMPLQLAEFQPRPRTPVLVALNAQGTAKKTFKWSTCSGRELGIAFLNPSGSINGRRFTVTAELKLAAASKRR